MSESKITKNLIKGTLIYAIGSFGSKILSFLIVPLYTYYISTSDMGVYDILNTTVGLLTPIITLQISDAAYRWMIRDENTIESCIKSTVQVLLINCTLAVILILFVNSFFPFLYCNEFIILLISSRVLATLQKLLRGLKNQQLFVKSSIIYTVFFLLLNVFQICILKLGVRSLFISASTANIISIIYICFKEDRMRINLFSRINLNFIKEMIKFSAPLVPNQLNWWIINSSDRYIVTFFLGTSMNGIYSIAYKFPSMLQLILGFFNTSWQDVSVADTNTNSQEYYTNIFKQLYRISFSLLWCIIPYTKIFITLVMSNEYKISSHYISFLYLSTVFQSFASFYGVGYLRDKNTKKATTTSIYGAIINAVVNVLLINYVGLHAASFSTFIGFFIMWMIREKQNRRELGIKIDKIDFMKFFIFSMLIAIISCISTFSLDIIIAIIGSIGFLIINKTMIYQMINILYRKFILKL